MNSLKYFSYLFIAFITTQQVQGQEPTKPGADLWEMVKVDTFPYLRSMDGIYKTADASLLSLFVAKKTNNDKLNDAVAQAYYYNLLAKRYAICDSILQSLDKTDTAYMNIMGHVALKEYVPCFGVASASCDSIRMEIYPLLKSASIKSELMPKGNWKWLYQFIDSTTAYDKSSIQLQLANDSLSNTALPSLEGGVVAFKIKEGKQNLFISNGSRKTVQILELDSNAHWKDITSSTNLDLMPGGDKLYNIDYNNDGLDDIYILRKSSHFKSPATYRSSLLKNKGDGTFEEVTLEVGLDNITRANCACWNDINDDGKLDVFIGNQYSSSFWMVQDEEGRFENQANAYNILTNKKNVIHCLVSDINGDEKKDLLLSVKGDTNMIFIQELVENQYKIFKNKIQQYDIKEPIISDQILSFNYDLNGSQEILVQANYNYQHEITADILNRVDTINAYPSYFAVEQYDSIVKVIASPQISLIRAGVVLENFQNTTILGGGGQNTESLYPMFQYEISKDGHQVTIETPENWPAYVHSMAVYADSLDQPVIVVKGGGTYPFMVNKTSSYQLEMPEEGKFIRLFDYSKSITGSRVKLDYVDTSGESFALVKEIKPLDDRGFNALQEWFWAPEGTRVQNIEVEEKVILQKVEETIIEPLTKKEKRKLKKQQRKLKK